MLKYILVLVISLGFISPAFAGLGECISTGVSETCANYRGTERAECNRMVRDDCRCDGFPNSCSETLSVMEATEALVEALKGQRPDQAQLVMEAAEALNASLLKEALNMLEPAQAQEVREMLEEAKALKVFYNNVLD